MNFEEWIEAQPATFPLTGLYSTTPFQNPIIGDDPGSTYFNVRQVVILLKELIEPYEGTQPGQLDTHYCC